MWSKCLPVKAGTQTPPVAWLFATASNWQPNLMDYCPWQFLVSLGKFCRLFCQTVLGLCTIVEILLAQKILLKMCFNILILFLTSCVTCNQMANRTLNFGVRNGNWWGPRYHERKLLIGPEPTLHWIHWHISCMMCRKIWLKNFGKQVHFDLVFWTELLVSMTL